MANITPYLVELYQSTKADCVGLIQLKPTIKELGYLEKSLLGFFTSLPIATYVPQSMDLVGANSTNNVIKTSGSTIFFRIIDGKSFLYASTGQKDINVAKYYSMLTLISNKL